MLSLLFIKLKIYQNDSIFMVDFDQEIQDLCTFGKSTWCCPQRQQLYIHIDRQQDHIEKLHEY